MLIDLVLVNFFYVVYFTFKICCHVQNVYWYMYQMWEKLKADQMWIHKGWVGPMGVSPMYPPLKKILRVVKENDLNIWKWKYSTQNCKSGGAQVIFKCTYRYLPQCPFGQERVGHSRWLMHEFFANASFETTGTSYILLQLGEPWL